MCLQQKNAPDIYQTHFSCDMIYFIPGILISTKRPPGIRCFAY